jgi:hypothetical protein
LGRGSRDRYWRWVAGFSVSEKLTPAETRSRHGAGAAGDENPQLN